MPRGSVTDWIVIVATFVWFNFVPWIGARLGLPKSATLALLAVGVVALAWVAWRLLAEMLAEAESRIE